MTLSVCVSVVVVEGLPVVYLFAVARKCLLSDIYCMSLCVPNEQIITLPISEQHGRFLCGRTSFRPLQSTGMQICHEI